MSNMGIFSKVSAFIDTSVQNKDVPGAVIGVVTPEENLYVHAAGFSHATKKIKMSKDTIFDLASLTKVTATLPAILLLLEDGVIDLDDPVYLYISSFKKNHGDVTIKQLLTHTSGFQPEIKFHLADDTFENAITKISEIDKMKQVNTEVIYSDLNYILLGFIIEQVSGMSLEKYTKEFLYEPLGMNETFFNPPQNKKKRIAATEFIESLNDYQWGKVHDENANQFGGVSGHAGVFSTLNDLSYFAKMILNGGVLNNKRVLSNQVIELSTQSYTDYLNLNRGLGWQMYDNACFSGQFLKEGFGHTGFTGTSIWFSPDNQFAIIMLTNRVHFGRNCNISRFRRITHNLIAIAMDKYIYDNGLTNSDRISF